MILSNCPYCRNELMIEIKLVYKPAQFFCTDEMMIAEVPKLYGECVHCSNHITYTSANFYTLYYLDVFKNLMGKIHNAKKEM